MARSTKSKFNLQAPYLLRVWLDEARIPDRTLYPFCISLFAHGFELTFEKPITILIGENGTGKSTLIEGIAAFAGYDDAGGGKGYRPIDHQRSLEASGGELATALRASWRPKVTNGWFFKAETFFSVARYLDEAAQEPFSGPPPDYLSHSHGEGFMRFFEERCRKQGLYLFDEPESALSPARQLEFLRLLQSMSMRGTAQVIMATHSPILMAYPGASLLQITKYGIEPVKLEDTQHFRLWREFCSDPAALVDSVLQG